MADRLVQAEDLLERSLDGQPGRLRLDDEPDLEQVAAVTSRLEIGGGAIDVNSSDSGAKTKVPPP